MCREDAPEPTPALTRLDRPPAVLTPRRPPIRHAPLEVLPHHSVEGPSLASTRRYSIGAGSGMAPICCIRCS